MIDFDDLVEALKEDLNPRQMAARFEISEELAGNLKDHFDKYGVSSVMGGINDPPDKFLPGITVL